MTLTRAIIGTRVAELADSLTKKRAAAAVEETFQFIKAALAAGEGVLITGFGKFTVRNKHARVGRNPRSGEPLTISARRVVGFKPSPSLKAEVNRRGRSSVPRASTENTAHREAAGGRRPPGLASGLWAPPALAGPGSALDDVGRLVLGRRFFSCPPPL